MPKRKTLPFRVSEKLHRRLMTRRVRTGESVTKFLVRVSTAALDKEEQPERTRP